MVRRHAVSLVQVAAVIAVVLVALHYRPGIVFFRRYDSLAFGMTIEDVESHFKRPLDLTLDYRGCTIGYVSRGSMHDTEPTEEGWDPADASIAEIPDFYGNVQFLFDERAKLVAYTWNGEELHIHTVIGDVAGCNLNVLDEDHWAKVLGAHP
ncbi:MAG: hypothetical protein GY851_08365 [bacterium]|nr:hypothetical protein [bacterium]